MKNIPCLWALSSCLAFPRPKSAKVELSKRDPTMRAVAPQRTATSTLLAQFRALSCRNLSPASEPLYRVQGLPYG